MGFDISFTGAGRGRTAVAKWPVALLAGVLTGLVGCGTADNKSHLSKISAPPSYSVSTSSNASSVEGWLADFNSPQLNGLIAEAQEQNLDLQISAARLMAAFGAAKIGRAVQLPTLSSDFGAARNKRTSSSGFRLTSPKTDQFDIGLDFAWELDLWGRLAHRSRAAYADLEAAKSDLLGARFSLAANTAKSWFRLIEADLQLRLAESSHESFKTNLTVLEERFKRGVGKALDVRLTRANVASAESIRKARRRERDESARALEVLLGRYPADKIVAASALPIIEREVPAGLPSELLARRPDLVAAERRLASADERFKDVKKNLLPNISLTTSAGYSSSALEELLEPQQNVWRLAANLVQPIFRGGQLKGARMRAEAVLVEQIATYSQAVLGACQEVENALGSEIYLREQEAALKVAATESIAAEELAWDQYTRGLVDIVTVLESQRRSVSARGSLLLISRNRLQNRIDLYLALGGEFFIKPPFNLSTVPPVNDASETRP